MARTELEQAGGFFIVRVGDDEVRLPELMHGEAREWSRRLAAGFGPVFATYEQEWQPGDGLAPVQLANERAMTAIVDSLLEYDRTGVLGGREGIERMSTSAIHRLYRQLYEEAHPFDGDLSKALEQMATMRVNAALGRLAGASSTNGSSPDGNSPRRTSIDGLQRDSSSSSGNAPSSAKSGSKPRNSGPSTPPYATPSSRRRSARASGKRGRT